MSDYAAAAILIGSVASMVIVYILFFDEGN